MSNGRFFLWYRFTRYIVIMLGITHDNNKLVTHNGDNIVFRKHI